MKKAIAIAVLLVASLPAIAQPTPPITINASCADLDQFGMGAMDAQDVIFGIPRSEWNDRIAGAVTGMAWQCTRGRGGVTPLSQAITRKALALAATNRQRAQAEAQFAARSARQQQAATAAAAADRRAQLAACQATPGGALYGAQERVIAGQEMIAELRGAQAKERRVAQVSGVRDLSIERNNGASIVESQDEMNEDFAEYKRLGGRAPSALKVTHAVANPCADLSAIATQ